MRNKIFLILIFILFYSSREGYSQIQITNYTNKNNINAVAVSGDNVWLATSGGIVHRKTDGTLIAIYTIDEGLPHNYTTTVLADSDGNIWCGNNYSVVKFDVSGMTICNEVPSTEFIFEDSQENLWFARNWSGLVKYDGSSWTTYTTSDGLPYNYVYTIHEDDLGNLWFGYGWYTYGVTKFDGTNWTTYTVDDGLVNNSVYTIEDDNSGNMWFGTIGGGVSKFDGTSWENFTGSDSLLGDNVYDIHKDNSGNLWFGIYGEGINKYDGANWSAFTQSDSLSSNYNYYIFEDTQGNIWFHGDNLDKFDGTEFTSYSTSNGLSGYCIYENQLKEDQSGNLWMGYSCTYKGLDKFNGSNFTNYIVDYEINSNYFYDILEDHNGDLWFALSDADSLLKFDGTNWSYPGYHMGINTSYAYSLFEDRDSNLWFGIYSNVGKWDGITWTNYYEPDGLAAKRIESISQDTSGNMWFGGSGSNSAGASKFDGVTWDTITMNDGLDTNRIYALLADSQGNIWFGYGWYSEGITRYDGTTLTTFTTADGITSTAVFAIFEDSKKNIWVGGSSGISKYDGSNWTSYSWSEGYPGGTVYKIKEDEFGVLWLATGYGVVKFYGTNWGHYTLDNNGLVDNYMKAIEIDNEGNKWVGSGGYGLSIISCEAPDANFTYSGASYPDTVEFTNTSTIVDDFTRYEWDINNDGITDTTTQDARHIFMTADTFKVKLIAWNDNCKDSIILDVIVEDLSLKGKYTIGPGGDYPTFNAAKNDLVTFGVSGHVNFSVLDSVYNEQVVIPQIPGASDTSQISFISQSTYGAKLNFSPTSTANNYTLKLNGADYIKFENLIISSSGANYSRVIEITNESSNNYFYNNKITGNKTGDSSLDKALVYSGNSSYDNNNRFMYNTFIFGSYGIYLNCPGIPCETGTNISGNTFTNQSYTAIDLNYQDAPSVTINKITASTEEAFTGISLTYCNGSLLISRNEILTTNSGGGYGIILTNSSSSSGNEGVISNNFIQLNTKTGFECRGIWHNMSIGTSHNKIYHNTVNITGDNPGSECARISDDSSSDTLYIINNLASNMAGGYCFYVDGTIGDVTVDYNCYYTTGPYFAFYQQNFATLTDWQNFDPYSDQYSISVNPQYVSFSDLHVKNPNLKAGTPLPEVLHDIDYDTRDPAVPFIGADEALGNVTFNVNMVYWKELGKFDPTNDTVDIAGDFNNWGSPVVWMDDYQGDLIYSISYQFPIGQYIEYKFRIDGSWETDKYEFPSGPNRTYTVLPGDNVLDHWFNDDVPDTLTFGNIHKAFNIWFNATQYWSPAINMACMADQLTTEYSFCGSEESAEPRNIYSNSPGATTEPYLYRYWQQLYKALFIANDALKQIEAGTDVGTGGEHNEMVKAWCYFIQGITHGYLGLVFDQAFIIDETTDTSYLVLKPYNEVINAATGYLDQAISVANSNTFTLPIGWINGYLCSDAELARIANSFAARLLVYSPRNAAGNATIDWASVLNYANNGITEDFSPLLISSSDNDWLDYYLIAAIQWYTAFVDFRIINLMDPNYPVRWPADGTDPGEATSTDTRFLGDFEYLDWWYIYSDNGYYPFSRYRHKRYQNVSSGYKPNFLLAENDLLKAEASLKLGNSGSAINILNAGSRVTRGGLPALASALDEEILNAIFYERDIDLILSGMGIGYFDMRRRDKLQKGTLLHFPVPAQILEENNMDVYTYGGENNADGINTALGWNSWDGSVYVTIDKTDCASTNDWIMTVHATGENGPFQYSVNNGASFQTDSVFYNLTNGDYQVIVKNSFGDDSEPKPVTLEFLAYSLVATRDPCYGESTGFIKLTTYGGVPPYTFIWSNGAITQDIYQLSSDMYSATITDNIGCSITYNVSLGEFSEVITGEINGPQNVLLNNISTYKLNIPVTYQAEWYANGGNVEYNYSNYTNLADSVDVTWTSTGLGWLYVRQINENGCYGDWDTLFVQVTSPNQPIADASNNQTVDEYTIVYLDGSYSSDPNNDNLTYTWYSPAEIKLSDNSIVNPMFIAPIVSNDTTYYFGLVVNDGYFNSLPDTVGITVKRIDITVSSYPYDEDFENGIGGWHPGGTNSSWQFGTPAGTTINYAYSYNYAWATNLTGDYNANEISYVESPLFDFSNLENPVIEMKVWWDAEGFYDGANLQYKIGTGSWETAGALFGGQNWYNSPYLHSFVTGFGLETENAIGWSGDGEWGYGSNDWVTARYTLFNLGNQSDVKFRVAFASNTEYQNDGFAFDDVSIYQSPVGIDPVTCMLSGIEIYPNPNKGIFYFDFTGENKIKLKLELINLQGQVVFNEESQLSSQFRKEIDVSYLPAGIYYMKMTHEETVVVKKIVKE